MRKWMLSLSLLLFSSACCADKNAALVAQIDQLYQAISAAVSDVPSMDAAHALKLPANAIFLDVRADAERAVSVLPGAITLAQLPAAVAAKPGPVLVYCTVGYRSGLAARKLQAQGIDARNLRGGILAWIAAGGRIQDAQGKATKRVHVYAKNWAAVPADFTAVF
jgi:rhodanese-related sulfurtransferase